MTQSDSPDFEFDPSDLEVAGDGAPASESGEGMSVEEGVEAVEKPRQTVESKRFEEDVEDEVREGDADDELSGFDIDAMPDAFTAPPSVEVDGSGGAAEESEASEGIEAANEDESIGEDGAEDVSRVEAAAEPKPMRPLGADDLGADVFAEIDEDLGAVSFEDVLEDLMDQVDDFEAGGFVELDEEGEAIAGDEESGDTIFKFDDPDDSLQQSVDPNYVAPEPEEVESEPEAVEAVEEETFEDAQPEVAAEAPVKPVRAPQAKAPEAPRPQVNEPQAKAAAPKPLPREIPSDFEIPADPVEAIDEIPSDPVVESATDEPEDVFPEAEAEEEVHEAAAEIDAVDDEAREPVEGHERVLFDADAEEARVEAQDKTVEAETVAEAELPEEEANEAAPAVIEDIDDASDDEDDLASEVVEAFEAFDAANEDESEDLEAEEDEVVNIVEESPELVVEDDVDSDAEGGIESQDEAPALDEESLEEESDGEAVAQEIAAAFEDADEEGEDEEISASEAVEEVSAEESDEAVADETTATDEDGEAEAVEPTLTEAEEEGEDLEDLADLEAIAAAFSEETEDDGEAIEAEAEVETPDETPEEEAVISEEEEVSEETVEDLEEPAIPAGLSILDDDDEEDLEAIAEALEADDDEEPEASVEPEAPGLAVLDDDDEEEEVASPADPAAGLEILDDEEEEVVEEAPEPAPAPEAPGLAILDDDDDEEIPAIIEDEDEDEELLASSDDEIEDVTQALDELDEEEEVVSADSEEEDEEEVTAMPSADDLLKQAGSILNANTPADEASSLLGDLDDDEVVAMPDPTAMMEEASGLDVLEEDEETEEAAAEEESKGSGNVADRAGDLPPPPPAPVEIIDDEPLEEDVEDAEEEVEVAAAEAPMMEVIADEEATDSLDSDLSIDDFEEDFDAGEGIDDDVFPEPTEVAEGEEPGEKVAAKEEEVVVEMPKLSLLWRITHSITVAAAVLTIAAGWILATWRQQIIEYIEGRDLDGSALVSQIQKIGAHALEKFDENGLYRMQWVDSEVRQVAKNEIRMHALVGARLRENLYQPVLESELTEKFGYNEEPFVESVTYAYENFPEEIGTVPHKPWDRLYRMSASKDEVLPLRIIYRLTRETEHDEWELSGVKVSGHKKELEWPKGEPAYAFGEHAYDIDSPEFAEVFSGYKEEADAYIAQISTLKSEEYERMLALRHENEKRRERVLMSLSQGAFFNGVAIVGEDGTKSEDVTMVITEIRDKGALVKGVFQMDKRRDDYAKFFVGSVDFETISNGTEQGVLTLRTVSMSDAPSDESQSAFFDPQSVSRIRLKTDGFRLEGDTRDLSLRMTRSM